MMLGRILAGGLILDVAAVVVAWLRALREWWMNRALDRAAPAWPEVNHEYIPHPTVRCCEHCGGGRLHAIHKPPYDSHRMAEIEQVRQQERYY